MILSPRMLEHWEHLTFEQCQLAMQLMGDWASRPRSRRVLPLLPALVKGQADDLILEWSEHTTNDDRLDVSQFRFWRSRLTREDGARFDREIYMEHRYVTGWRASWGWRRWTHGSSEVMQ